MSKKHDPMETTVGKLLGKDDGYPPPYDRTQTEDLPEFIQEEDRLLRVERFRGNSSNLFVEIIKDDRREAFRTNKYGASFFEP